MLGGGEGGTRGGAGGEPGGDGSDGGDGGVPGGDGLDGGGLRGGVLGEGLSLSLRLSETYGTGVCAPYTQDSRDWAKPSAPTACAYTEAGSKLE